MRNEIERTSKGLYSTIVENLAEVKADVKELNQVIYKSGLLHDVESLKKIVSTLRGILVALVVAGLMAVASAVWSSTQERPASASEIGKEIAREIVKELRKDEAR